MQAKTRGTVVVDLKVGESLSLELNEDDQLRLRAEPGIGQVLFTLRGKHGQRARVVVQAVEQVKVRRTETPC
jgi:hypothetical protein